ncbi:hypothetical protein BU23DRAFT_574746 [Bimuria novae-zelandiae CBS 107.79]|uniref:NADAR domain-containing protein n=1 Tax=Bimuria novae-zelandiae CBS 107.79 TaxID=1447943 RepID=A0A6A5ULN2_9PLEO|nr:hypothetical protein BU23DRAFT_574746 [Bimuria novae-zelandiae CBS 107.79]
MAPAYKFKKDGKYKKLEILGHYGFSTWEMLYIVSGGVDNAAAKQMDQEFGLEKEDHREWEGALSNPKLVLTRKTTTRFQTTLIAQATTPSGPISSPRTEKLTNPTLAEQYPSLSDNKLNYPVHSNALNLSRNINSTTAKASEYVFFWRKHEAIGYVGNWYTAPFITAEALDFGDEDSARYIYNSPMANPHLHKNRGRKVKGLDEEKWSEVRREITYRGCMYKFVQNKHLGALLLATGYKRGDAVAKKANWETNILGQLLEDVRTSLRTTGESEKYEKPQAATEGNEAPHSAEADPEQEVQLPVS